MLYIYIFNSFIQALKEEERRKNLKKRLKKIRTRMNARGKSFLEGYNLPDSSDSPLKRRISKSLTQIDRLFLNQGSGPWSVADASSLDRNLLDLQRVFEKGGLEETKSLASLDGVRRIFQILDPSQRNSNNNKSINNNNIVSQKNKKNQNDLRDISSVLHAIPDRSLSICLKVVLSITRQSTELTQFILDANLLVPIVDLLVKRLQVLLDDSESSSSPTLELPSDLVATALMEVIGDEFLIVVALFNF